MKHLFLIDGSGFIFRAYHALPPMTRSDGTPVGAVYGFTKMIIKLVEDTDADAVAVVLDRARKTFRNDIYPEYKAHRPPAPDDLVPQFALVRDAVEAMDLKSVDMEGYEADDLIATYACQAQARGIEVTIVSSDKDLMQLVGPGITMLDAMKDKIIGPDQVFEKFGVGPERVIDVQALAGDSSDNVPGVAGIGVKTAALLINEYGDLDGVLENAHKVKQNKRRENLIEQAEQARISRELVTLKKDVPIEMEIEDFILHEADPNKMMSFLAENNFKSLLKKMEAQGFNAPKSSNKNIAGEEKPEKSAPENKRTTPTPPTTKTYELVQGVAALERWVAAAFDAGVVAVDTETTGLDSMDAQLVGVSLSYKPGHGAYIPLAHRGAPAQGAFDLGDGNGDDDKNSGAPKQIEIKKALAILKPLLEDPGVLKIGQNIKYDQVILARNDIDVTPVDDTMVISYVLEGGLHGHGMDELALLHLGTDTIKFKDVAGTGKSKVTFDYVGLDKALDYAAEDADITLQLHQLLKPRLVDEHMVSIYENIERPLISVLANMETNGIKVDAKILKNLSDDFSKRLAVLEKEIHLLAGREFNIASPKQLGEILFDELGLEGGKKSKKTGAWSTGADVLEELSHVHELPSHVLGWRQLAKLKSTYTDALQNQINGVTKRVHTSYSMAATSTGRLASSDPNLQNIPIRSEEGRAVRTAFVAEKGNILLSADYSQIELRILAHVAGIDALKTAFHDGLDIHAMTASEVFGVPVKGMDPDVRRNAKAINFGIIYGISAFGLARQLGISRTEAKEYIDAYFKRFPGIRDYMEETKASAAKDGFVSTLFGRKCFVPGINDKNQMRKSFAERAAINAPIQGGAADIIKRAMLRLPDALNDANLKALMLLQVHDELVFELPKGQSEKTIEVVKSVMEGAASLDVPLVVDCGIGSNWGEAH